MNEYSRCQLFDAQWVEDGVEGGLGVAEGKVHPRPVEEEAEAHFVPCLEATQRDGGALPAIVGTFPDEVVAL